MYQVLYRKWRPRTFSEVYGQGPVTAALKNEVKSGRLAHAYLFTGSRGTGKTTCAKILAKAVNCLHPVDGDPCNECDVCRGIDSGAVMDVAEIDAASNNGVDNIRDLREEVNFTPAVARFRVYIIDEVHMLSAGAFNALLKTLEEPPAHVIFILATTEVHKLPATILSRCQRFDFRRIPPADIAARLHEVAEREGVTLDEEAGLLLARLADGALRDALSLLDQCLSRSKDVTADVVAQAAGLAGRDYLYELSAAVREKDGGAALSLIDRLYGASKDMERLCAEWIEYFRNLMILKSVANPEDLIVAPPAELARMREEAARFDLPAVLHCMQVLQQSLERLRGGVSRRVEMEMAVLKLCSPELDTGVDSLLRRVRALENAVQSGGPPSAISGVRASHELPERETMPPSDHERAGVPAASVPTASGGTPSTASEPQAPWEAPPPPLESPSIPERADAPPTAGAPTAGVPAAGAADEVPFPGWADVLETLRETSPPLYGVLADSTAVLRGDYVLISTDNDMFKSLVARDGNKAVLLAAIRGVTGRSHRIGVRRLTAAAQAPADDPLTAFLQSSRALGVDVHIKE